MFGAIAGALSGLGGIASGIGSAIGASKQASASRAGAREYMDYIDRERDRFLNAPENLGIRQRLSDMALNDRGFSPDALQAMRSGVQEDYGRALSDMAPQIKEASVIPGVGYAPGRANRTARLLGENLAVRKAEANRDITMRNNIQAQNNMRYAISALPTYMPGFSQSTQMDPSVFQAANAPNMALPYALNSIGSALMQSPMAMYYGSRI